MTTTVTKSIGSSGRDFSTLQAWEDDLATINLVTADEIHVGECYNDSEFTSATDVLVIAGQTADATRYLKLTAASGQSFADHTDKLTNALKYNASNGVGIRCSGNAIAVDISTPYTHIERVQIKNAGNQAYGAISLRASGVHGMRMNQVIVDSATHTVGLGGDDAAGIIANTLFHHTGATGDCVKINSHGWSFINCTIIRSSDHSVTGRGLDGRYISNTVMKNCAVFGFTTPFDITAGSAGASSGNNCTDAASISGSSNQTSKTFTSQFEGTTNAAADFRLKTGSDCIDAGTTDATNAATDIVGTSRPSGGAYDIGAWEFASGGGGGGTDTLMGAICL